MEYVELRIIGLFNKKVHANSMRVRAGSTVVANIGVLLATQQHKY